MSVERGVTEATVRMRTPRVGWMMLLVAGALWSLGSLIPNPDGNWDPFPLVLGAVFVGESLWMRTFGIDLTPESANVRGIRRRSVPWSQVQAVWPTDKWAPTG